MADDARLAHARLDTQTQLAQLIGHERRRARFSKAYFGMLVKCASPFGQLVL
jgi:hypothetical protein